MKYKTSLPKLAPLEWAAQFPSHSVGDGKRAQHNGWGAPGGQREASTKLLGSRTRIEKSARALTVPIGLCVGGEKVQTSPGG